ncbi:MAG TPA: trypsin-like peptidase domain-containing protein [Anaerolineales bacterium]|nr:trypsin-like peptidase domain-containing protein [Anaerolineales bacterium]
MKKTMNLRNILLVIVVLSLVGLACGTIDDFSFIPQTNQTVSIDEEPVQVEEDEASDSEPVIYDSTDLVSEEDALIQIYQKVSPGVVSIVTYHGDQDTLIPLGSGSGFVIDTDGHIVTNYHVVENATEIQVAFPSGIKTRAEVIGTDTDSDLAVLDVDLPEEDIVPVPLGDSDSLQVGQFVVAIGNPFGLNGTMTIGIVSSLGRTMQSINLSNTGQAFSAGDLIQTDAAINPGNSGGPLLNMKGEVIGVNRAINTFNTNENLEPVNSGIGFAVSVNIVKRVVPSLIADGKYDYPYLGISSWDDIPLEEAERLGLDKAVGALVTSVVPDGPAEAVGLQIDDVILAIDGMEVINFSEMLSFLFNNTQPGDVVELTVFRNGETISVDLTVGARPQNTGS